jgi:anionic cell wall polymer biosynthesis LytR-Cps2A-Psr (LCP) family protein
VTVETTTRRAIQEERRRANRKTGRRWPRRLLIVAIILVVLAGGLYGAAKWYENYRYGQIKKVAAPHLKAAPPAGQPIDVLLVGSDSRKFATTTTAKTQFGTATITAGQRSDVTMVARFVPATEQVYILSIPRDLWVHIPGNVTGISGMNRINAAFNTGPDQLVQTIETDLHIPINHYQAVTFKGF